MYGMISRTNNAVLDHSCGANLPQATTFGRNLRYKQMFSKLAEVWCNKKDKI